MLSTIHDAGGIGGMRKWGRGSARTFHDLEKDVISSGLQKTGVRRGDRVAGRWYLLEWLLFQAWLPHESSRAKAQLTNLENRLTQIYTVEDVLAFAQPCLVLAVLERAERWNAAGRSLEAGRYLLQAFEWQVDARRGRIGSDLRAFYTRGITDFGLNRAPIEPVAAAAAAESSIKGRLIAAWVPTKANERTRHAVRLFVHHLEARTLDCIYYAFQAMQLANEAKEEDAKVKAKKSTVGVRLRAPDAALWEEIIARMARATAVRGRFQRAVLRAVYRRNVERAQTPKERAAIVHRIPGGGGDTVSVRFVGAMHRMYTKNPTRRERFLYLVHAALHLLYRRNRDIDTRGSTLARLVRREPMSRERFLALIEQHRSSAAHVPEPWVQDMHTASGRAAGASSLDFAQVGSVVTGEDAQYLQANMRDVYQRMKQLESNGGSRRVGGRHKRAAAASSSSSSSSSSSAAAASAGDESTTKAKEAFMSLFRVPPHRSYRSEETEDEEEEDEEEDEEEEEEEWVETVNAAKVGSKRKATASKTKNMKKKKKKTTAPPAAASSSSASSSTSSSTGNAHRYDDRAPKSLFGVGVVACKLAQLPCGAKSPTWLVRLARPIDVLEGGGGGGGGPTDVVFVRPLPLARHERWDFDPVEVDRIKARLGLVSAHSARDADTWLVARDLGLPPIAPYSYVTRQNRGVEVVDKLLTGLVPISTRGADSLDAAFCASLWETLLWRFVLGCSDTNGTNILWSTRAKRCVSVDEMNAGAAVEAGGVVVGGLANLWAHKSSAAMRAALVAHYRADVCRRTLGAWDRELQSSAATAASTGLVQRMRARIDWLLNANLARMVAREKETPLATAM